MGLRQTAIIWIGTLLVVGMALYPPWACVGRQGIGPAAGYHWLFAPSKGPCVVVNLDFPRLMIQWVVVGLLAAVSCLEWPPPAFFVWLSPANGRGPIWLLLDIICWFLDIVPALLWLATIGLIALAVYAICEAHQLQVESAMPTLWIPKGRHWLSICVTTIALGLLAIIDEIRQRQRRKRHV
jgi:hypothetical protein